MYRQRSQDDRASDQARSEDQRRSEAHVSVYPLYKCALPVIDYDDVNNTCTLFSLEGVHVDAYRAFQMSRDLEAVIHRFLPDTEEKPSKTSDSPSSRNKVAISLMTPVLPMLVQ